MRHPTGPCGILQSHAASYRAMRHPTEPCGILQGHAASYRAMQHPLVYSQLISCSSCSSMMIQNKPPDCQKDMRREDGGQLQILEPAQSRNCFGMNWTETTCSCNMFNFCNSVEELSNNI
eukprot:superscaffoldBa00009785_g24309